MPVIDKYIKDLHGECKMWKNLYRIVVGEYKEQIAERDRFIKGKKATTKIYSQNQIQETINLIEEATDLDLS